MNSQEWKMLMIQNYKSDAAVFDVSQQALELFCPSKL